MKTDCEQGSEELQNIRNRFVQSLSDRLKTIDAAIATIESGQASVSTDAFRALSSSAHQLSGTAGSVGFQGISDAARELSHQIRLYFDSANADFSAEKLTGILGSWQKLSNEITSCIRESALARQP